MFRVIVRFFKRFAVLLPGILIVYLSFASIYPLLDRGTPDIIAFFITYIIAAYVLIPAAIRGIRLVRPPKHLPLYNVTPDGFASDPVNIGIIATRKQLIEAMEHAGWHVADKHTLPNMAKEVICTFLKVPYPNSPMSTLYLFGRKQDIGFEIPIEDGFKNRHHVRFWFTSFDQNDKPLTTDSIHWIPRKEWLQYKDEPLLWLGAASKDIGVGLIRHNAQLTHMIHPDTDAERDLIVEQLEIANGKLIATIPIQKPSRITNRVWRGYLQTDGQLKIVKL